MDAEARLVLQLARVRLDEAAQCELAEVQVQNLDWERVHEHASRNGVLLLVWKHLVENKVEGIPADVRERCTQEVRMSSFYSMRQTLGLRQLVDALEEASIPVIPFKGPVLAYTAYGDISYRTSIDLDLLVRRSDFDRASAVLEAEDYVSLHEEHAPEERAAFIENLGGYDYGNYEKEIQVELHWKLFPAFNALHFDIEGLWDRHRPIPFAGDHLRALAPEDMLIYLCAHGAKHRWAKLKWLCDVAEYLRVHPHLDWDQVEREAERMGVQRIVHIALRLVRMVWPFQVPDVPEGWSARNGTAERLARHAFTSWLLRPLDAPEPSFQSIFWYHFRERERWWDRMPFALHNLHLAIAPSDKDRDFVRLPEPLSALYLIARPVRLLMSKSEAPPESKTR